MGKATFSSCEIEASARSALVALRMMSISNRFHGLTKNKTAMTRALKPIFRDPDWFPTSVKRWMENFWNGDRFFDTSGEWMPAINIKETEQHFEVEVAAPGMKKDDFKVTLDNGMLSIAAQREASKEEKDANYSRREFNYSSFQRMFTLPENVDENSIAAKYENGLLKLSLKKTKASTPKAKMIEIK
jgi:HSP20 family protein